MKKRIIIRKTIKKKHKPIRQNIPIYHTKLKFVFFSSYQNINFSYDICKAISGKYHTCPKTWRSNHLEIIKDISNCDIVIIWNSLEPCVYWIKNICNKLNKPYLFLENGFVPQKNHLHLDTEGIIKQSSLNKSLDWLTNEMEQESEDYISQFFVKNGLKNLGSDYILCPLQLPWDTSVYLCSKYNTMEDFIKNVIDLYPNEKIIVTPHPCFKKENCITDKKIKAKIYIDFNHPTMELAQNAKCVVGITSTVLYETLALGKKTVALGDCPIKTHNGDRKVVLCAIQKQFNSHNIDRFLDITMKFITDH